MKSKECYYGLQYKEYEEIIIITNPRLWLRQEQITNEVQKYNDFFYYCRDRVTLEKFALKMKDVWKKETYDKFLKVCKLNIESKYLKRSKNNE